jgi:hypothetical protein
MGVPTHEDYPWARDARVERQRERACRPETAACGAERPPPRGPGGPVWSQGALERGSGDGSAHANRWWRRLTRREEHLLVWAFFAGFFVRALIGS